MRDALDMVAPGSTRSPVVAAELMILLRSSFVPVTVLRVPAPRTKIPGLVLTDDADGSRVILVTPLRGIQFTMSRHYNTDVYMFYNY